MHQSERNCPTEYFGIGRYFCPIDWSSRLWPNRVVQRNLRRRWLTALRRRLANVQNLIVRFG